MKNKQVRSAHHILYLAIVCSILSSTLSYISSPTSKHNRVPSLTLSGSSTSEISNSNAETKFCTRISPHEASALIKGAYKRNEGDCDYRNLLVITSDASRGSKRHTGICAFLREVGVNNNATDNKTDLVTTATRRIRPLAARDIFKSEVAAIALGIKTALQNVPNTNRSRVLLLADSASAITFFCGDESGIKLPLYDHPHYKGMYNLLSDSEVYMSSVKSCKIDADGFFDHEVCDQLSSFVKSMSNKKLETIHGGVASTRVPCHRLRHSDLLYLEQNGSTSTTKCGCDSVKAKKKQIHWKKDRFERQQRCRERIGNELGIILK